MKRKSRPLLVLAIIATIATGAWLLVPGAFGHGVIVGFFAGFGLLLASFWVFGRVMRKRLNKMLEPPPLPTTSWDYTIQVADLEGKPVSFSESAGSVLVLNFWATWCAPCVAEMPSLGRLLEETADLDVRFGFITREDPRAIKKFIEKRGIDLPIYVLSGEPPECFKGRTIPATFVLDKAGMIALRHFGAAKWDAERVVAFVRGLAAKPAT